MNDVRTILRLLDADDIEPQQALYSHTYSDGTRTTVWFAESKADETDWLLHFTVLPDGVRELCLYRLHKTETWRETSANTTLEN